MRLGLALPLAIGLAVGACASDTVRVPLEIVFPSDAPSPLDLEVVVVSDGTCAGDRPTARGDVFREGDTTPIELQRGDVAVWIGAWSGATCGDGRCYVGCATADVRRSATLRIPMTERSCEQVCGVEADAGLDGGMPIDAGDGGPDDGGPDAGDGGARDGGGDAGPPPACGTTGSGYVEVAVGYDHTCALDVDGDVVCWGVNTSGEAGAPPSTDVGPTAVILPAPARALGAGADFSCALLDDDVEGQVYCWGNDGGDQDRNGDGTRNNSNHQVDRPVVGVASAVGLAVGYWHACVALEDGGVRCWGQNASAELGADPDGDPPPMCTGATGGCDQLDGSSAAFEVTTATAVAAGLGSSCALVDDGAVRCWGYNVMNQLSVDSGAGDVVETPLPVEVGGADVMGFTAVASKGTRTFGGGQIRPHVCGVQAGRVACWGANDHGQSSTAAGTIVPVSRSLAIDEVHAVAPGADHTCVIYGPDRRVTCWGRNDDGQLGNGTAGADVRGPDDRPIADFDDVCSLSAGERHTCATRADGSVWCWGSNASRRLGDAGAPSNAPRRISLP